MRLSSHHNSNGLSGFFRSLQTGEMMRFTFPRGTTKLTFQMLLGDRHMDAELRLVPVTPKTPDDELDLKLEIFVKEAEGRPTRELKIPVKKTEKTVPLDQDGYPQMAEILKPLINVERPVPDEFPKGGDWASPPPITEVKAQVPVEVLAMKELVETVAEPVEVVKESASGGGRRRRR